MECIYIPEINKVKTQFKIPENEIRHLKALHIRTSDEILATNGEGLSAIGTVSFEKNETNFFLPTKFYQEQGELNFTIALAIGVLDNKERFEFALEKAVELGIKEFYPLITKFSQRKKLNLERLNVKAIAAMTQCKRSRLPIIHEPCSIKDILVNTKNYERIILTDINGGNAERTTTHKSTIVFVGPEGGFSEEEINLIKKDNRCELINLGNRRLRAETAAIIAVGLVSLGY
jgi:16S rRNA (uracil1498-N3)-methyltransferase